MSAHLTATELQLLATCMDCSGTRVVPDIFGECVLCQEGAVMPRDPF